MIFGHTLAECRKAVIGAVIFLGSGVALVVAYDPGIKDAIVILLGNGFAVAGVFLAPKFSVEDLSKTLAQLSGSVFTLVAFFAKVDPSLPVTIGSIIALIPIGYAVWKTKNLAPLEMEIPLPTVFGPPHPALVAQSASVTMPPPPPKPPPPGPPDPPVPPAHRPVA